jgi:hypothetical protein
MIFFAEICFITAKFKSQKACATVVNDIINKAL